MRLVSRQDVPVLLGLVAAVILSALNPLSLVTAFAPATGWGSFVLAAVQGLALLGVVLGLAQRRQQPIRPPSTAPAMLAEVPPDLDRFLGFSRALARAVDADGVTAAIEDHLTPMIGAPGTSVLLTSPGGWAVYAGDRSTADDLLARVATRHEVLTGGPSTLGGQDTAIPLRAAGETIGLLVVQRHHHDLESGTWAALEAAAALLAVAVKNLQLFRELHETNLRDPLTGCASRTHGLEVIDSELRRARRSQQSISLVLIDVDHLKDTNSRFGYACGDAVLAMVGRRLRDVLRRSDLKCRYGGEEFLVLLPETSLMGARRVAETIRREIADRPMPWNGDAITVTASLGVTQALAGEVNSDAIIARAESAAHRAQEEGHNTVRVASDSLASLQQARGPETL